MIQQQKSEMKQQLDEALEVERRTNETLRTENLELREKLNSSIQVMRAAVGGDEEEEDASADFTAVIAGLMKENEALRDMLSIRGDVD
ncbi:hypothetical protein HK102_012970, partial [Quaeritorhiza haematococci]